MLICNQSGRAMCFALLTAVLASCATSVETTPAIFVAASGGELSLTQSATVLLPTRYTRVIPEGSRWRKVGTVTQGEVYRAVGTVFTIEGRNIHEAYLIVSPQRALVGFYLSGEAHVSMLPQPVQLSVKENP